MDAIKQGIRKVAILVSSLDTRAADAVLDQMPPQRAQQVRDMIMDLDNIDPAEQKRVIDEFFRSGSKTAAPAGGGGVEIDAGLARRLGLSASGKGPTPRPSQAAGLRMFASLEDAEADKLAAALATERPQTIALVLAHLVPQQSGAVLVRLRPVVQAEVLRRLVDLEETDPDILREVETALEARLSQQVSMQRRRVAGFNAVSGILESCAGPVGMQIMASLDAYEPSLAERFSPPPVEFDELPALDDASLACVFREAGTELTQLALVGAEPPLVSRVLRRFPVEQAAALREAIEFPSVIRLRDVEEARTEIAEVARRLAAQGRIRLPRRHATGAAA